MNGILVDTNVISELTRDTPDSRVVSFFDQNEGLWLSTIVVHELKFEIELLPLGGRRDRIYSAITALILQYGDRILPVRDSDANQAAVYRAQRHRTDRIFGYWRCSYCRDSESERSCYCNQECSRL